MTCLKLHNNVRHYCVLVGFGIDGYIVLLVFVTHFMHFTVGKRLLDELIPIHCDHESGFVIKDRVFHSQDMVRLAITALQDKINLCKKYCELLKKGSIIKAEFSTLVSNIKRVSITCADVNQFLVLQTCLAVTRFQAMLLEDVIGHIEMKNI